MLNGSRSIAVSPSSTFYLYELPNFKSVKKLTVLLLHTYGGPKYETCSNGTSLKELEKNLKAKNITYACEDNPKNILFYMCFENPYSKECQSVKFSLNKSVTLNASGILILLIMLALVL